MSDLRAEVLGTITEHGRLMPRSQQRAPGVSDIAAGCDHCVAAKLAGWTKTEDFAWLAYVGTAIHAQLEQAFTGEDWWTEYETRLMQAGQWTITGHVDLIHRPTKTVIDFKTVGKGVLDAARAGHPPQHYVNQVQLYAHALQAERVVLAFLPRNQPNLGDAVWVELPYQRPIAERLISRVHQLLQGIELYGDVWISALDRDPHCYDCARYPDAPITLVQPGSVLAELLR